MKTYVPKEQEEVVVKFTKKQLEDALENLSISKAQKIGIPLTLENR